MLRRATWVFLFACGSSEPPPSTPVEHDDPGPTRAETEAPSQTAPAPELHLTLTISQADGVTRFDVHSPDGFPGRAMDPTLHVGATVLTDYSHPDVTVLRFETRELLEADAIELRWGEDVHPLTPTLNGPAEGDVTL